MAADADESDPIEHEPAARAGLYAVLARCFDHPDDGLHEAIADGRVRTEVERYVQRSDLSVDVPPLSTDDDYDNLAARYNDLFVIGFSQYEDRTDGTLSSDGPPVALYESAYRPDVSWNDVNLDLARAYDYFGLGIDESDRDNHDALALELEFASYLCRREAAVSRDAGQARLDFLDRHLHVTTEGVADRLEAEPGTGFYGDLGALLDRVVRADRAALVERFDDGSVPDRTSSEGDRS